MPTVKRRAVGLLSCVAAALALAPASAHGASPCNEAGTGTVMAAGGCAQQISAQTSTTAQAAKSEVEAKQAAFNYAQSSAGNETQTSQTDGQGTQNPTCVSTCGGGSELSLEQSTTTQRAESEARAEQSAASGMANNATSVASNSAATQQGNYQSRDGAGSSCSLECGGEGQTQLSAQDSTTTQAAQADAHAKQDLTSANLPLDVATDDPATTNLSNGAANNAASSAGNEAQTSQTNGQTQDATNSSCLRGCESDGQAQLSFEQSTTAQRAESQARAEQSATNGAEGQASNNAATLASDNVTTTQSNYQSQDGASEGQAQASRQSSTTTQRAEAEAQASQNFEGFGLAVNMASADSANASANANTGERSSNGSETSAGELQPSHGAESDATIQLIWQAQLSECVEHCAGIQESQSAEQQNETVQVSAASQAGAAHGAEVSENDARIKKIVTQIQLGCVSQCFGTTTTTAAPMLAGYTQAVGAVLRAIGVDLSMLSAAAEQNKVEQISYQSQRDSQGQSVQTQSALQSSTSVQRYDVSPLIAALQEGLEGSPEAQAVNETVQAIWQLQVGCVMFCNETKLSQSAVQSGAVAQTVAAPRGASSAASSSLDGATQLVFQAQIGCLFWCYGATEQQTAMGQSQPTVREGDATPPPASGELPPPPPPPGNAPLPSADTPLPPQVTSELTYAATLVQEMLGPEAAALLPGAVYPRSAPVAASAASSGAGSSSISSATGTAQAPSTAPALPSSASRMVRRRDAALARLRASRPHRGEGRGSDALAAQRVSVQLAAVAPRPDVRRSAAGAVPASPDPPTTAAGLSDGALRAGVSVTSNLTLATLLSGFALCALCVFGIALAAARRDPRASKPGAGG
jgi:trimeric autotransporter adhesin